MYYTATKCSEILPNNRCFHIRFPFHLASLSNLYQGLYERCFLILIYTLTGEVKISSIICVIPAKESDIVNVLAPTTVHEDNGSFGDFPVLLLPGLQILHCHPGVFVRRCSARDIDDHRRTNEPVHGDISQVPVCLPLRQMNRNSEQQPRSCESVLTLGTYAQSVCADVLLTDDRG